MDARTDQRRFRPAILACVLLALVGLGIAIELTQVYILSRTDPGYQSFCAVSEGMNCETVALSSWSTVFGVPVSVWAEAGYAFAAIVGLVALVSGGPGTGVMVACGAAYSMVSLWLIFVMAALIRSFCILCLALDVVNFGYLALSLLAASQRGVMASIRDDLAALRRPVFGVAMPLSGVAILLLAFWYGKGVVSRQVEVPPPSRPTATTQGPGECGPAGTPATIQMGESDGHPWVGAEHPAVEVQEFTDYQCPHCRRAHMMVRRLLSEYPTRLRVYHRHLPLDQACNDTVLRPFHDRACELSRIAYCAGKQARFWEMNDFLFQHADEIRREKLTAEDIAARLELSMDQFHCCMDDPATKAAIASDIEAAKALGLRGTPAFVVDGQVYYGQLPDSVIERLKGGR